MLTRFCCLDIVFLLHLHCWEETAKSGSSPPRSELRSEFYFPEHKGNRSKTVFGEGSCQHHKCVSCGPQVDLATVISHWRLCSLRFPISFYIEGDSSMYPFRKPIWIPRSQDHPEYLSCTSLKCVIPIFKPETHSSDHSSCDHVGTHWMEMRNYMQVQCRKKPCEITTSLSGINGDPIVYDIAILWTAADVYFRLQTWKSSSGALVTIAIPKAVFPAQNSPA